MRRTVFLVDGFNLYHSLAEAERVAGGKPVKWLDLRSLCSSFLFHVGNTTCDEASLERIHYFSAPPSHDPAARQERHRLYMQCLRATGVIVELSRFKMKEAYCRKCGSYFKAREEKETDVAIATRLFETCFRSEAESVVLVTGDSDQAPAVRACQRLFPSTSILFAFPFRRSSSELKVLAPDSFSIGLPSIVRHQLPNPLVVSPGKQLQMPESWRPVPPD